MWVTNKGMCLSSESFYMGDHSSCHTLHIVGSETTRVLSSYFLLLLLFSRINYKEVYQKFGH